MFSKQVPKRVRKYAYEHLSSKCVYLIGSLKIVCFYLRFINEIYNNTLTLMNIFKTENFTVANLFVEFKKQKSDATNLKLLEMAILLLELFSL